MSAGCVVVVGAAGAAGRATAERIAATGRTVAAVDLVAPEIAGCHGYGVDATSRVAVRALAAQLVAEHGGIDGLVHLIGGWRGGKGFTANLDEDWEWLRSMLVDTLRHTTLEMHDALVASDGGRVVIVSATAAANPTPGGANYATAKAAAETWLMAMADSFARKQKDTGLKAAATALVIKALVTPAMRAEQPDNAFAGFTDVADLADEVVRILEADADAINGERLDLTTR